MQEKNSFNGRVLSVSQTTITTALSDVPLNHSFFTIQFDLTIYRLLQISLNRNICFINIYIFKSFPAKGDNYFLLVGKTLSMEAFLNTLRANFILSE